MTRKKGGERESGADILRKMNADAAKIAAIPEPPPERLIDAAADPPVHKHSWEGLYCPEDGIGSSETLRELEAEHLDAMVKMHLECDRLEALAERAEARVAKLKEHCGCRETCCYGHSKAREREE